jgi:hypothetical protein
MDAGFLAVGARFGLAPAWTTTLNPDFAAAFYRGDEPNREIRV